jgi:septal ring factor EnvC (AmiA/AmiB activator)
MALIWLALALSLVAVIVAAVFTTLRGLELFRSFRALGSAVGPELARIERSSAEIEGHLQEADRSSQALAASLERLRRSRAELDVLLAAFADARSSLDRITGLWPAK